MAAPGTVVMQDNDGSPQNLPPSPSLLLNLQLDPNPIPHPKGEVQSMTHEVYYALKELGFCNVYRP